jgi:uncharacterized Zn-finger protein
MSANEEQDRILVRSDGLARCSWCSTPESSEWVTSAAGKIYCSNECLRADEAIREQRYGYALLGIGLVASVPLIAAMVIYPPYGLLSPLLLYGLLFLVLGLGRLGNAREGRKYLDRQGKYEDVAPLECPYCNQLNPPNAVRCLQCDAPLAQAPFATRTTPPWIQHAARHNRVRCPHCSAVYSYPAGVDSTGHLVCQNCGKRFVPPNPGQRARSHDSRLGFS